ncbi:hypothetical protein [Nocardia sp. NPDC051833]|uniref:hypothetical protein n=1 Tax=Nocardia sp. NPDC051833 TaxID=3155674 RepID=UPI00343A878F
MNRTLLVTSVLALALLGTGCSRAADPVPPTPTTPPPTTPTDSTTPVPIPSGTHRREGDSYDPTDPNSVCFGAKPELPRPYAGCPGYDPSQPHG